MHVPRIAVPRVYRLYTWEQVSEEVILQWIIFQHKIGMAMALSVSAWSWVKFMFDADATAICNPFLMDYLDDGRHIMITKNAAFLSPFEEGLINKKHWRQSHGGHECWPILMLQAGIHVNPESVGETTGRATAAWVSSRLPAFPISVLFSHIFPASYMYLIGFLWQSWRQKGCMWGMHVGECCELWIEKKTYNQ